jgi:hypothetical protein
LSFIAPESFYFSVFRLRTLERDSIGAGALFATNAGTACC